MGVVCVQVRGVLQVEEEGVALQDAFPLRMLHDRLDALEFVRRRGERVEALLRHGAELQDPEDQGWELVARSAWRRFVDFVSLAGG